MIKKILGGAAIGVMALVSIAGASTDNKVLICHYTGSESNPTVEISVSSNAVQAHLNNGDTIITPSSPCGVIIPG